VTVVEERGGLKEAVEGARGWAPRTEDGERIDAIVERYLGVIDGKACERTVAVLREEVERARAARTPEAVALRERLAARRPPLRLRRRTRQGYKRLRRGVGAALGR
jgi:hypothetical protein